MEAVCGRSASVDFVKAFGAVADRYARAVATVEPRCPVLTCPPWRAHDLTVHLGNVHAWAATIVETGRAAAEQDDRPTSGRARALSRWYAAKAEDLYAVLRQVRPGSPCWNFVFGDGEAAFWPRRQLHETTMHLVDLNLAAGRDTDLDPDVCVDGVTEVLEVMMHRMHHRGHAAVLGRPLALHAVDTGHTWLVSPNRGDRSHDRSGGVVPRQATGTRRTPTPPSVTMLSGPVGNEEDGLAATSDVLYRLLWNRPVHPEAVQIFGDQDRVRRFTQSRLVP